MSALDALPGFRRRIRIEPARDKVVASLEDDFHCMTVTLRHDGERILSASAEMSRAPWTTCPGARQVLEETFAGTLLDEAARRGLKQANCTHLYDLAVWAAGHARDTEPTDYEVAVSDPVEGEAGAKICRDGAVVLAWTMRGMFMTEPAELAGKNLLELRDWIVALEPVAREAARILQWASLIAHGRSMPLDVLTDATQRSAACYTYQPEMAAQAVRVGRIIDFSTSERQPLEAI